MEGEPVGRRPRVAAELSQMGKDPAHRNQGRTFQQDVEGERGRVESGVTAGPSLATR